MNCWLDRRRHECTEILIDAPVWNLYFHILTNGDLRGRQRGKTTRWICPQFLSGVNFANVATSTIRSQPRIRRRTTNKTVQLEWAGQRQGSSTDRRQISFCIWHCKNNIDDRPGSLNEASPLQQPFRRRGSLMGGIGLSGSAGFFMDWLSSLHPCASLSPFGNFILFSNIVLSLD
jgi:hypothetical protein